MEPQFVPGDFILTHRHRLFAALITLAQRRRFQGPDARFAHWSHAALIVGADGALVEAETMGVTRSSIKKYRDDEFQVVRLGEDFTPDCRAAAVAYAEGQVGQAFGYLDMVAAALHLLFGWPLRWVRRNHEICSSLVVKALQHGGRLRDFDPPTTLPADLAKAFE
ncbi:MAG TPA: hypothetical protein VFK22_04050 [Candidatus Dormibacteraeota bacterium]|nr:hypothetical protein [Candidatus Dormibacteraeota bacterium]